MGRNHPKVIRKAHNDDADNHAPAAVLGAVDRQMDSGDTAAADDQPSDTTTTTTMLNSVDVMTQCEKHIRQIQIAEKNQRSLKRVWCSFCDRSFVHQSSLRNHEKTHTRTQQLECDQCELRFATKTWLLKHTSTKHSDRGTAIVPRAPDASSDDSVCR